MLFLMNGVIKLNKGIMEMITPPHPQYVQVMDCRLFCAKPFPEPMRT